MGLTKYEALQILGLEDGCTEKEIRDRFKKLALKWHPDKNFHNPDEAQKKFQVISAAYSRLISKEEDDIRITLGDIFSDFHRYYNPHAHVFCDCDICREEWGGMDYSDIVGSDTELFSDDDDYYYEYEDRYRPSDRYYADQLLRAFAERLYRNFNGPSRMARKARETAWEESVYKKKNISAEEASRNADELLKAEEEEKREAEKKRQKNKKKRDAKKKRKAKKQGDKKTDNSNSTETSESVTKEKEDEASDCVEEEVDTDSDDDEIDISSAFVARASKKNSQQQATPSTGGVASSASGLVAEATTSSSATKSKGTFSHKNKEEKKKNVKSSGRSTRVTSSSSAASADLSSTAEMMSRSRKLAGLGNIAAKDGHFSEAVRRFSEAIELYPFDHRYFGNRSFCYDYLQDYDRALEDANSALRLDTSWPKGYYRQGRAYAGLKHLDEAEESYVKALQLDPDYKDAEDELFKIRLEQLSVMGFTLALSEVALKEYKTVQAAVEAILAGKVTKLEIDDQTHVYSPEERFSPPPRPGPQRPEPSPQPSQSPPQSKLPPRLSSSSYAPAHNHGGYKLPPRMRAQQREARETRQKQKPKQQAPPSRSQPDVNSKGKALWVGNINSSSISEGVVRKLFQQYGEIVSVRMLRERHCAFINFAKADSAAQAMKGLQGKNIDGCYLLLRYPENSIPPSATSSSSSGSSKKGAPVNGNECYYWRTTGCTYGAKCRYRHIPASKGVDLK